MNSSLSISSQPVFTAKISVIAQAKLLSKEDSNTLKAIAKNIGTDDDIIHLTVKESKSTRILHSGQNILRISIWGIKHIKQELLKMFLRENFHLLIIAKEFYLY